MYRTIIEGTPVHLHPSSSLFNRAPEWLVYHELVLTTKEYMREVTAIEPKWLVETAPQLFKTADATRISKRKKQEKIQVRVGSPSSPLRDQVLMNAQPLFDRHAQNQDDWRPSQMKKMGRNASTFG